MNKKEVLDLYAKREALVVVTMGNEDASVYIRGNISGVLGIYAINIRDEHTLVTALTFNEKSVTKIDGSCIEIDMSKETE